MVGFLLLRGKGLSPRRYSVRGSPFSWGDFASPNPSSPALADRPALPEDHQTSTTSCSSGPDQSSGASHPRIRPVRTCGLSADELVWTDRFVFRGAAPRIVNGTQVSASPATRDPTIDNAHPGIRHRARFHSLNVPCLIGEELALGGWRGAAGETRSRKDWEGPGSSALSRRRLRPLGKARLEDSRADTPAIILPVPNLNQPSQ